ncbi:MAG TPA: malto-oligosyltrehalose synthase [Acidimicrobiales bacterium]|nr:malto-oligosyltrehalose synthase [Acidimicrobiales bacterium]
MTPTATYRLQLHHDHTLDDARAVLPRLVDLGASHVYLSPVLAAVPGSLHGYDVVDHSRVAPDLGGDEAWDRFTEESRRLGLGVVVDVVPNHVSIEGGHNRRWLDVLEHGASSSSAEWFDIDWVGREDYQKGIVVLPVLGDLYGELLVGGEIRLCREGVRFGVEVPGHRFPLAPRSLPLLLHPVAARLADAPAVDGVALGDAVEFVADSLDQLQPGTTDRTRRRRAAHLSVLQDMLGRLLDRTEVAAAVDDEIAAVNADPEALHRVLEEQHHRLTYWRTGARELDYRRFFDITTLAAIRVERPAVFDAVHELPLRWLAEGRIDGLRIDHPDGLADPGGYVHRLRAAAPEAWIVVEKILEGDEELPDDWPVDGTTGYEAMRLLTGVLVDPAGLDALAEVERAVHERCGTEPPAPEDVVAESKRYAVEELLAPELERVVDLALRVAETRPLHRDHPRDDIRRAVAALAVGFEVYRTYVVPGADGGASTASAVDVQRIDHAAAHACEHTDLDPRLVGFLADVLTLRAVDAEAGPTADERELIVRFQQLTGPATAKGLEDTAWYRLGRFIAAAEVGGDPLHPAVTIDQLHEACRRRQERWPHTMTTLSTHDTKRSADVRARLAVLSEPGLSPSWPELADRWIPRLLDRWPADVAPDAPTLLVCLQTLLGAWPISADRLEAYLVKAAREAKARTAWTRQDEGFERGLAALAGIVDDADAAADLAADAAALERHGWWSSLVQTAIGLLQPGVPDVYQGTETIELSLVDPDNRRPVDHDLLAGELEDVDERPPTRPGPAAKLALTAAALRLRRRRSEAFGAGDAGAHHPLHADGPDADRIVAFRRGDGVAVVTARFPTRGPVAPGTTVELPQATWEPVFGGAKSAGGRIDVAGLLGDLPVAVLERRP